jgi:hypothetical protein
MSARVIQWATGNTGRLALDAIIEAEDLDLVGLRVYDEAKQGRDAGDLAGRPPIGITATADVEQILATPADIVVYMANVERYRDECFADVARLLESGKNVVATGSSFIDPTVYDPALGQSLATACQKGQSSFLGLGLFPGFWGESVAPLLSRLSFHQARVTIRETLSYAGYPSRALIFDMMGYGYPPGDPTPVLSDPKRVGGGFVGSAAVIAKALGLEVRSRQSFRDTAVTDKRLEVASGVIEPGTVGAMRIGIRADCGPVELLIEHVTFMGPDVAPDWPTEEGYEIEIDGEPSMRCRLVLGIHGEDHTAMGCRATAMHAIHSIPAVVAAPAGVLDLAAFTGFAIPATAIP